MNVAQHILCDIALDNFYKCGDVRGVRFSNFLWKFRYSAFHNFSK